MSRREAQRAPSPASAAAHAPAAGGRSAAYAGLALIAIATFIAYLPAIEGALVWNDSDYVTRPELRSVQGLGRIWFDLGATEQYYPLLHSFFWVQSQLWSNHPLGHHLVNVLLHVTAVCLLYLVLRKLKIPGALLAAGIFALHPVMVETVAWITEQKNTLSTVFYLGAMWVYLDFDQTRKPPLYAAASMLYILAMASKTVTATLPAALLVIFWWQRGSVSWRRDVLPLAPWFTLGIVAGMFTAWVERTYVGAEGADFPMTDVQRILIAGRVPWFYAAKLFWPANLMFMYPRWDVDPQSWRQWLFPLGCVALLFGLWLLRGRWRGPLAACLLFIGTLVPVLGFLNVYWFVFAFAADHLQYLASLALIALASAGIALAIACVPDAWRWIGYGFCTLLLGILATLTWQQSHLFADDITLYQTSIARNPSAWLAYNNLGATLLGAGETQHAIEYFHEALRLKPTNVKAHVNLANALAKLGRPEEAMREYEVALQIGPTLPHAHYDFGCFLLAGGRIDEAIEHFQTALRLNPRLVEAYVNLGTALAATGHTQNAIEEYQQALQLNPDHAEAYYNLGIALARAGQIEQAIQSYQQALRLKPTYAEAHLNLGNALANTGQLLAAIEQFQQAIQLQPGYAEAHHNLAAALADSGRVPEAIVQYEEALQLKPDYPSAHINLGNILAQSGRMPEAVEHYQQALELARANGQTALVQQIEAWLASHRAEQAIPNP